MLECMILIGSSFPSGVGVWLGILGCFGCCLLVHHCTSKNNIQEIASSVVFCGKMAQYFGLIIGLLAIVVSAQNGFVVPSWKITFSFEFSDFPALSISVLSSLVSLLPTGVQFVLFNLRDEHD